MGKQILLGASGVERGLMAARPGEGEMGEQNRVAQGFSNPTSLSQSHLREGLRTNGVERAQWQPRNERKCDS